MARTMTPGRRLVTANCTCGWSLQRINAQGVAAQHVDRHGPGHRVTVEVLQQMVYENSPPRTKRAGGQGKLL